MSFAVGEIAARCSVITGAASGIGRELAFCAADNGMAVALADRNFAGLQETANAIEAKGGRCMIKMVDVSDTDAVKAFADEVFDWAPSVAMIFSNAGVMKITDGLRPDLQEWSRAIAVNLLGTVNMVHAFMSRLVDSADWAQFVFVGSMASFIAVPKLSSYGATKHAVWGLVDTLRVELAEVDTKVALSFVAPGPVRTPFNDEYYEHVKRDYGETAVQEYSALQADPADVAKKIFCLAREGEFLIIPTTQPMYPQIKARYDKIFEAERRGFITRLSKKPS